MPGAACTKLLGPGRAGRPGHPAAATIGLDNAAPNQTNPQGLRIQFQKVESAHLADAHAVRYRLLVPGAPESETYTLAVWRIGTQVAYTPGQIYTNARGLLMWHLPKRTAG